ncbi:tetratricopeptide repeat protein [Rhizobium leguminosarum]|uniref:tetratricopeptide repeat protein n=1 Tax=Rhizobium leguminosarum TaxID=384 RepID=UPI001030BEE0|nr:hypothetical protein [Rhizobium leguminosarum]TAX29817.1 hypothetical protein ELI04_08615 [Rhizobium leguminosarum]
MDMFGYRAGDPSKIVGIQCKCKGLDEQATEAELREDLEKALRYEPKINEYYFTTTAADHAPLQTVAAKITEEQRLLGRRVIVRAWGWGTLEQRIAEHPDVALVFDPNHSSTAKIQEHRHEEMIALLKPIHDSIVANPSAIFTDATSASPDPVEMILDAEIDRYRDLMTAGQPKSALKLLQVLLNSLTSANSAHIWFRVKANIGHCHLHLGDEASAADFLDEAVRHAPKDPKALVNAVLALTLRERNQEALDLARGELEKDSSNEVLAAYAVQAAGLLGIRDVLSVVPKECRDKEPVLKYQLNYLRSAGDDNWRTVANEGLERCPDDAFYLRHSAEAKLEALVKGEHAKTWLLTDDEREIVKSAAQTLQFLWDEAKAGEVPARQDNVVLCLNAASALMLMGEFERASSLIEEGLSIKPGDPDLCTKAAAIALETSDGPISAALFDALPVEGAGFLLKIQIAAHNGNWTYLADLRGDASLKSVPHSEVTTVETLTEIAYIRSIAKPGSNDAADLLSEAIEKRRGAARPLVLLAQLADELSIQAVAKSTYEKALHAITRNSHVADRQMLARYAARRRDHAAVILLLDGHIETQAASAELLELASAFAYQFPPKSRGLGFFTDLPAAIRETAEYTMLEGILHYHRGDLASAEDRLRMAVALDKDSIKPLLMLGQTLLRQKKKDAIPGLVSALDPFVMNGSALDRIHLAHLLRMSGRLDDALRLGFATWEAHRNEVAVNLKWLGLTFGCLSHLQALSDAPVDVGMWTSLSSDDGQMIDFTVVASPGRPAERKFDLTHALAAKALGLRVGGTFHTTDGLGRERIWSVNSIEHQYLHAHRDVSENFNERFPDESGFWIIKSTGDDLGPFMDVVRRHSEKQEKLLDHYTRQQVPIALLAEFSGASSAVVAETLRSNDIEIEVCEGTLPERNNASQTVRRFLGKGVVLDTLTHWAAVEIGAIPILKHVFGRVLVARSTVDELLQLEDEASEVVEGSEKSGTAFYHNGKFYYDEMTPERRAAKASAIQARIDSLNSECDVVPVHAPDDADPEVMERLHGGALDPIFVAREHEMLLISDDKRYRIWAASQQVPGAWLQIALMVAVDEGAITLERYALLSADLASMRHGPVSFNASVVNSVVRQSTPDTQHRLFAIARCLGVEKADMQSHLNVLDDTLKLLWSEPTVTSTAMRATGLLLQNVIRFRPHMQRAILARAHRTLSQFWGGSGYVPAWQKGHFIPDYVAPAIANDPPGKRGGKRARRKRRT